MDINDGETTSDDEFQCRCFRCQANKTHSQAHGRQAAAVVPARTSQEELRRRQPRPRFKRQAAAGPSEELRPNPRRFQRQVVVAAAVVPVRTSQEELRRRQPRPRFKRQAAALPARSRFQGQPAAAAETSSDEELKAELEVIRLASHHRRRRPAAAVASTSSDEELLDAVRRASLAQGQGESKAIAQGKGKAMAQGKGKGKGKGKGTGGKGKGKVVFEADFSRMLSVRQPWATALMEHGKAVENRTWRLPGNLEGVWILIVASRSKPTRAEHATLERLVGSTINPNAYPRGAIVGCIRFGRASLESSGNKWEAPSQFHWPVLEARHWPDPVMDIEGSRSLRKVATHPARARIEAAIAHNRR